MKAEDLQDIGKIAGIYVDQKLNELNSLQKSNSRTNPDADIDLNVAAGLGCQHIAMMYEVQ